MNGKSIINGYADNISEKLDDLTINEEYIGKVNKRKNVCSSLNDKWDCDE